MTLLPSWLWHPLGQCAGAHAEYVRCRSYNFWSGIASDLGEITLLTGVAAYLYKHNCHRHRCPRLSWQEDAEGHPVCKVHHEDHPARGWFRWDRSHTRHASNRRAVRSRTSRR